MKNTFCYSTSTGTCKGFFNIYQARTGAIIIVMGNSFTKLTDHQVNELGIDVYSLRDFSHEDYLKYYSTTK